MCRFNKIKIIKINVDIVNKLIYMIIFKEIN